MTLEEAKKKVEDTHPNFKVDKSVEYEGYYIFVLKHPKNIAALVDPVSVNKETGSINIFNPITVGGETFSKAMSQLK